MTEYTNPLAETNHFIILDRYNKPLRIAGSYQSEDELERELVKDLQEQGYELCADLNTPADLLANARLQLQTLNKVTFTDDEWQRFVANYLDKPS
jgi:type I restriction enzyme R subunit